MLWRSKKQSRVLSVAVRECTKMESDTHVSEKCNDICAETVIIGFHAEQYSTLRNFPLFS